MTLGDRIKNLRNENRLTQEELADKLSLAKSTISLYETDKREPEYETLKKIASCFNVTVDYLLGMTYGTQEHAKMEATLKDGTSINEFTQLLESLTKEDQKLVIQYVKGKVAEIELAERVKNKK